MGHFRLRAYDILTACSSYAEGAPVGSVLHNLAQSTSYAAGVPVGPVLHNLGHGSRASANIQKEFQSAVNRMMNTLIAFFTKNGSTDCEKFRSLEIYNNVSAVATANLEVYKIESSGTTLTQV